MGVCSKCFWLKVLKLSQNKKDLNNVKAALFSVCFFAAGSWEKNTEKETAVTSLRSFLFCDNFKVHKNYFLIFWVIFNFTNHSLLFMGAKSWQELINSHMLEWHVFQCLIKISWNLETNDVTKDLFVFKCGFCWVKNKDLLAILSNFEKVFTPIDPSPRLLQKLDRYSQTW